MTLPLETKPLLPVPKPTRKGNPNKARSRAMERGVAAQLNEAGYPSTRQPLSGALRSMPGDVDSEHLLLELKNYTPVETNAGRMLRFDINWLKKVMDEAKALGKLGAVVYQAKGAHNKLIVFDFDQFVELVIKRIVGRKQ